MDWGHEGRKIGEEKHCENGKEKTKQKKNKVRLRRSKEEQDGGSWPKGRKKIKIGIKREERKSLMI